MKILPCRQPSCQGTAWTPSGDRYWIRRYPGRSGALAQYTCARCERGYVITPPEFSRLPDAGPEALGPSVTAHVSRSHSLGGALSPREAFYLFNAGFSPAEVREMASDPPARS